MTTPANADMIYEALIALHEGRSEDESLRLNTRLILLLINQINNPARAIEVIELARDEAPPKDLAR